MSNPFDDAVAKSKTLPTQPTDIQLQLYGLYKQASEGDVEGARPGMLDVKARAKWDAWNKCKGMEEDYATEKYIELVDKLAGK